MLLLLLTQGLGPEASCALESPEDPLSCASAQACGAQHRPRTLTHVAQQGDS